MIVVVLVHKGLIEVDLLILDQNELQLVFENDSDRINKVLVFHHHKMQCIVLLSRPYWDLQSVSTSIDAVVEEDVCCFWADGTVREKTGNMAGWK